MKIAPLNIEKKDWQSNPSLIHQVVVKELASRRHGTAKVKSRNEVTGSTRKIYRQKGTGNARHGDIKAPLFVGGGQAFGPKPRDWSFVLPRQLRRQALKAAVALRHEEKKLWLLDSDWKEPKTKQASKFFVANEIGNALVVIDADERVTEKSIRNLACFEVRLWNEFQVADILKHEHLVLTGKAYQQLEGRVS